MNPMFLYGWCLFCMLTTVSSFSACNDWSNRAMYTQQPTPASLTMLRSKSDHPDYEENQETSGHDSNANHESTEEDQLNKFLDTQFFDPSRTDDYKGPLLWFANLVNNDYETAEALYAATFITILVIGTQEVLRMQLYGVDYVPFVSGSRLHF